MKNDCIFVDIVYNKVHTDIVAEPCERLEVIIIIIGTL